MEFPLERSPVKIAFLGTSCTGKTALLEHYKSVFQSEPRVAFVNEAARDFFATHPRIKHRFQERAQTRVQDLALSREELAHNLNPSLIFTDRSVLDAAAYVASQGQMYGAERLFERVKSSLPTYGHLFLLDPRDVPYQTDEIRTESETQRMHIHQTFLSLFRQMSVPFMLLSGNLVERTSFIDKVIKRAEGTGFNPVDPANFSEAEARIYIRQKTNLMYPNNERASSINYRGCEPLLQFVREGRLGIDSVIRVSDYGRIFEPHYQIVETGLEAYDSPQNEGKVYQPEEILNTEAAPQGWTISS